MTQRHRRGRPAARRTAITVVGVVATALAGTGGVAIVGGCEGIIGANFDVERVSCTHVAPPAAPPAGNYGGSGGGTPVILAAYTVDLGEAGGYRSIGYDQDGLCTNQSQGPSCATTKWLHADDTDGVNGVDNGVGALIAAQKRFFNSQFLTSAAITGNIQNGKAPPLIVIRVSDYNNITEDDSVTVEWFVAAASTADAVAPDWASYAVPLEDGTTQLGLDGKPRALDVDSHAYVSGGTLVARFDHGATIRLGNTAFRLESAVLTAPHDPEHGFGSVVVVGKLSTSEFFARLPEFTSFVAQNDVCKDNALYPQIKAYACSFEDIRVDGKVDPSLPCDALSLGLSVTTRSVTLGASRASPRGNTCTPATDPSTDDCSTPTPVADSGQAHDPQKNCVKPGTPNNEKGVGAYCETLDQCPMGSLCTAAFAAPDNAWFCSKLCTTDDQCGSNAYCAYDSRGHACVPFACGTPDGGPDAGAVPDAAPDARAPGPDSGDDGSTPPVDGGDE